MAAGRTPGLPRGGKIFNIGGSQGPGVEGEWGRGEGGSLTILTATLSHVKRAMIREIEAANPLFKNIPVYLSRTGLRIWERSPDEADRLAC